MWNEKIDECFQFGIDKMPDWFIKTYPNVSHEDSRFLVNTSKGDVWINRFERIFKGTKGEIYVYKNK